MKKHFMKFVVIAFLLLAGESGFSQNWLLNGNAGVDPQLNFLGTTDAQPLKFKTNNNTRMVILSSGKIGVGLASPVWKFDVKGGSINTDSSYRIGGSQVIGLNGLNLELGSASNRVGIGTSSPLVSLHVSSTSAEPVRINGSGSIGGMYVTLYESGVYRGYIGSYAGAAADVDFGTGASNTTGSVHLTIAAVPKLSLTPNGNIGIGTTSPVSRLSVIQTGTSSPTAEMSNSTKGPNISYAHFGTSGDWYIRSAANAGKVILQDQSASGTVAIGTTYVPSGYKLSVSGKVICSELKVQLPASWPDYVFSDDYSLKDLASLGEFIRINKHLPGIPSAADVENNGGFEIGKMQQVLLEKVEEMTLYILEQQKKIEQLEKLVNSLNK